MPSHVHDTSFCPLLAGALDDAGVLFWSAEIHRGNHGYDWHIHVDPLSLDSPILALTRYRQSGDFWQPSPEYPDYELGNVVYQNAIRDGRDRYSNTFRVLRGDRVNWLDEVVRIHAIDTGHWRLAGVLRDISAQRTAEQAEKRASADLNRLLTRADCLLWQAQVHDDGTRDWDWAFTFHRSELQKRLFPGLTSERNRKIFRDYDRPYENTSRDRAQEAMRAGAPSYQQEFPILHRTSGTKVWIDERVTVTPVARGHWELSGVMLDITDRKNAEQALADAKHRLDVTLHAMDEAVFLVTPDQRIDFANPAAVALLGGAPLNPRGQPVVNLLRLANGPHNTPLELPVERVMQGDITFTLPADARLLRPDQSSVRLAGCLAPLVAGPHSFGAVLVLRDITRQHDLQERLQNLAATESLGLLAGGIAHDFNNLLTVIVSQIGLARLRLPDASPAAPSLDGAETAVYRARDLSAQLLTFARGGEPVRSTVPLAPLLQDAATLVFKNHPATCRIVLSPDLPHAHGEPAQIFQIFHNLLLNAAQAVSDGGLVTVTARSHLAPLAAHPVPVAGIQITVQDTGPGVPAAVRERVFAPYFTTKKVGAGLGLAIVESVVLRHGGTITLRPVAPGLDATGACFEVWLPAAQPATGADTPPAADAPPQPRRGHIIIMDDEPVLRDLLAEYFRHLGHEVEETADGAALIELYRQRLAEGRRPDLLFIDLTVPRGMGGGAAMAQLLALDPSVRAIVMSGYSDDPTMARYREHGFLAAVPKPWSLKQLGLLLDTHLRPPVPAT